MAGWQFQYWNGSAWVNFQNAQIDHIMEELSSLSGGGNAAGQEECVFDLPNTAANRTVVQALPYAQCLFNGTLIFPLANQCAVVGKLQYSPTTIEVTLYNAVFAKLEQATSTVTKVYTNTAVSTIASYICGLAGVSVGTMPSVNVSITFNNANCFRAMQDLATACGLDYWGDANGFNIGTRDSTLQTLGSCSDNTKRGFDYTKTVDTVIVKGVSASGAAIQGAAYSSGYSASNTGSVASFTVKKVSDINTLNNVAALKLQKLNNPSDGNSLECLINQVATWHPGQYVSCNRPDLALVGSYIIQRITKQAVTCTVEVDAAMPQMDVDALQQDNDTDDLSVYTTQPQTQIPVNVTLQGLLDLYHLTEGQGTTANDSTPNLPLCPGTITFGSGGGWVSNAAFPGEYFLNLASGGYVDCPYAGNAVGSGSCQAFAIGGWFSPSALVNSGVLIGKANCYILELYGTQGAIRFGVYIGGAWQYVASPNGVVSVGSRCFAMGVYDGTSMHLYVSDPSGVNQLLTNPATGNPYFSQAQAGTVGSSTSDTYIGGSSYAGIVAEVMIWGRALQASEVQALFFQPLTQVVTKTCNLPAGAYLAIGTTIKSSYTVSLSYLLNALISGNIVQASAGGTMNSYESGYVCLALLQYGGSSYYSQVQGILDLWASLQNSDGSWYQQYYPYSPYSNLANLKVDSGAALLANAMALYDQLSSGTRYKTYVQNTMSFLRSLQVAHNSANSLSYLLANLITNGTTDTTALLADCAECLLAMNQALKTYGSSLQTSGGYSVNQMASLLYYSIGTLGWHASASYYDTSYPYGTNSIIPFNYQEQISYAQALCVWANKLSASAPYCGTIPAIVMSSWGSGYDNPPTVTISTTSGGGSGATGTAALIPSIIPYISVTNPGSGYTSAPTIMISGGGGSGAAAYCTVSSGAVTGVFMTSYGSGYTSRPTVTVSGGGGSGAVLTAHLNTGIQSVTITNMGSGYTAASVVSVTFSNPDIEGSSSPTASAIITVDYSSQCTACLNYIETVTRGSWGGEYYCTYTGASGQTQNNYTSYSAEMCIAANKVSSSTYASLISGLIAFIKWLTLPNGEVYDVVDPTGLLWPSILPSGSAGPFLALDIALALLAGAGS